VPVPKNKKEFTFMFVHCIARSTSIKPGLAWEVNLVIGGPITYLGLSFTSN